jgi:predicted ATPase
MLADAHCQASIGAGLLARLVDRSLVVVEDSSARVRHRLLETIAEYATERLAAAAE